jgi:hypothetical protein
MTAAPPSHPEAASPRAAEGSPAGARADRAGGAQAADWPAHPDWQWLRRAGAPDGLLWLDCSFDLAATRARGSLAYLAAPYTREVTAGDGLWCEDLSDLAEARVARWAHAFALAGVTVASPIGGACELLRADVEGRLDPLDDAFWARWCRQMLHACGSVLVPPMPGRDDSAGVWHEVGSALARNVPVFQIAGDPDEAAGG